VTERTTRGDFTQQAEAYSRARPSYPESMIEQLLEHAEVATGVDTASAVLELGAGTGLFTRELAGRGLTITATEPNETMRALAPALDGVTFAPGSFESTGVPDGSQAWAVAAQAFHWAIPSTALPEIHRSLAPEASFSVLWNVRDVERSEVVAWTLERVEEISSGFDEGYKHVDWASTLTSSGDFVDVRTITLNHSVRMSAERFVDLWRSHNHLNSIAEPRDVRALLVKIEEHLAELGLRELDVPYICQAWTVRRA
jgi:SAM-dependent methyltransferase